MEPYGTIWNHKEPYGTLPRGERRPKKSSYSDLESYGTIWNHMEPLLEVVEGESGVWLNKSFFSRGHVFCAYIPSQNGYNSLEVEASLPFLMEYQAPKNEAQIGPHREHPRRGEVENELFAIGNIVQ